MRPISEADLAALSGTTTGDTLEVNLWCDGKLVRQGLTVQAWSLSWDSSRQVQCQASLDITDADGTLSPWSLADPLSAGGGRLQLTWVFGDTGNRLPLEWLMITSSAPVEQWLAIDGGLRLYFGGGVIPIEADSLTNAIQKDRFLAPETPPAGATCLSMLKTFTQDHVPLIANGTVDAPVPSTLTFERERMDAIDDLTDALATDYRMTGDGALELVPEAPGASVWTASVGEGGMLIDVSRKISSDGFANFVRSTANTTDEPPRVLIGEAKIDDGPLRFGGPLGRIPIFHNAIATTQEGVDADAATYLRSAAGKREITLQINCITNPALQLHDQVTIVHPTTAGAKPLCGRVVSIKMNSSSSSESCIPAKSMSIGVRVKAEDMIAMSGMVNRG